MGKLLPISQEFIGRILLIKMIGHCAIATPFLVFLSTISRQSSQANNYNGKEKNIAYENGRVRVKATATNVCGFEKGVHVDHDNDINSKVVNPFCGRVLEDGHIFRQNYLIASYQIGPDAKAIIRSIMNILQDTPLNRSRALDLFIDGFGSTTEMIKRDLTWVAYRMHIVVDHYPCWGDIIEVDNYMTLPLQSNSLRSDCILRHKNTKQTLVRASSQLLMMNNKTRRLAKVSREIRDEIEPCNHHIDPIIEQDIVKLPPFDIDSADHLQNQILPEWSDIDLNRHVNSSKYIDWILESCPRSILESHELSDVIMEFQKECEIDSMIQSLTSIVKSNAYDNNHMNKENVLMDHLLRFESGPKVMRGKTTWKPKPSIS